MNSRRSSRKSVGSFSPRCVVGIAGMSALAATALGGCTGKNREGAAETKVVQGQSPSAAVSSQAVMLKAFKSSGSWSACSATYLGSNASGQSVFVTAAHCLTGGVQSIEVITSSGSKTNASAFAAHPSFAGDPNAYDVGVVFADGHAFSSLTPARIIHPRDAFVVARPASRPGEAPKLGERIVGAGFGVRDASKVGDPSNVGTLLQYNATLDEVRSTGLAFYSGVPSAGGASSGNACRGDSGGPAFVSRNSTLVLAGVISGNNSCDLPFASYSNLLTLGDWVVRQAGLASSAYASAPAASAAIPVPGTVAGGLALPSVPSASDSTPQPGITYRSATVSSPSNAVYADSSRAVARCFNVPKGTVVSITAREGAGGSFFRVRFPAGVCKSAATGASFTEGVVSGSALTSFVR
ncbi:MAG: trypsin-like serine protease [Silvanigrellales bacterium]|nr:trypsin-like serine protease [Silvanigrellales bacterium]